MNYIVDKFYVLRLQMQIDVSVFFLGVLTLLILIIVVFLALYHIKYFLAPKIQ